MKRYIQIEANKEAMKNAGLILVMLLLAVSIASAETFVSGVYQINATQGVKVSNGALNSFFVNSTSGNVGIGAVNPVTLLHLNGTSPYIRQEARSGDNFYYLDSQINYLAGNAWNISFHTIAGANDTIIQYVSPDISKSLVLGTTGGRVILNGYVEVGISNLTSSPTSKLLVNGTINVTNITLSNNCADGQVLKWANGVGTCGAVGNVSSQEGSAGYIPQFKDSTTLNNSIIYQNGANIGIGTLNPLARVQINATGKYAGTDALLIVNNESGKLFEIDNGGNITIGGADQNSGATLSLWPSRTSEGTYGDTLLVGSQTAGNGVGSIRIGGIAPLRLVSHGSGSPLIMSPNGFIGFGTYDPGVMWYNRIWIDINATAISTSTNADSPLYINVTRGALVLSTGSAFPPTERMRITNAGFVGIGTANPTSTLHVVGSLNVTNITLANNCVDGQVLKWQNGVGVCGADTTGGNNGNVSAIGSTGYIAQFQNDSGTIINNSVIYQNGTNVGIGTKAPVAQFHVTTSMKNMSEIPTNGSPLVVFVQGRYAYLANYGGFMQIIDVSNPTVPVSMSVSPTPNPSADSPASIYVQGKYAYTTNYGGSFRIIDVSDPSAPVNVSQIAIGSTPNGIYVQGRYAYIADAAVNGYLYIIDVSNPAAPVNISTTPTNSQTFNVFVQGRYAYVTNGNGASVQIIDVSNPVKPVVVSSVPAVNPKSVYVQGRYAYITEEVPGKLKILDISNASSPRNVSEITAGNMAENIFVQGRYAYVTDYGNNNLMVIDVANASSPVVLGVSPTGNSPISVNVQGRYAYIANYAGKTLQIIDLGGAYIQQLETGGIETGTLSTRNNAQIGSDLSVTGGIVAGRGAQFTGSVSIYANTTSSALKIIGSLNTTNITLANNCADGQVLKWNGGVGQCGADTTGGNNGNVSAIGSTGYIAQFQNDSGTIINNSIIFQNGTNIGIGTSSPSQKLDVQGSVNINGNITMPSNFYVGNNMYVPGSNAIALGANNNATGSYGISIGNAAIESANYGIALGRQANASGTGDIAIGLQPFVGVVGGNSYSIGIGYLAESTSWATVAIGEYARAIASDAVAVGASTESGQYATAIGYNANATDRGVAVGRQVRSTVAYATVVGALSNATGGFANAMGTYVAADGGNSNAIGYRTSATGTSSVAIGDTAAATANYAIAMGFNANASSANGVSIGRFSNTSGGSDIAIGSQAIAGKPGTNTLDIAIGSNSNSTGLSSIAIGTNSAAFTTDSIAIGRLTYAPQQGSIAIGGMATMLDNAIVIGEGGFSSGAGDIGIGEYTNITVNYATAIGYHAYASGAWSNVIGYFANATHTDSFVIGRNAVSSAANQFAVGAATVPLNTKIYGSLNVTNITLANNCADGQVLKWANGVGTCGSDSTGAGGNVSSVQGEAGYIPQFQTTTTLNNSVIYQNGTNVGVGTSSPSQKLDVNGAVNINGPVSVNGNITMPTNFFIGNSALSIGTNSIAIGSSSNALYDYAVAIGNLANASGQQSVAIGPSSYTAGNAGSVAVGYNSLANATDTVAIGDAASALAINAVAIGASAKGSGVAIGHNTISNGSGVALGESSYSGANQASAIGYYAAANGSKSLAVGWYAFTSGAESVAIGTTSVASAANAMAFGLQANASYQDSVAIGRLSNTTAANQLAIGARGNKMDAVIYGSLNATNITLANNCGNGQGLVWSNGVGQCGTVANVSSLQGASGYIPQFQTTTTLNNSNIYQSGLRIGINTTSPSETLHVVGNVKISNPYNLTTANTVLNVTGTYRAGIELRGGDGTGSGSNALGGNVFMIAGTGFTQGGPPGGGSVKIAAGGSGSGGDVNVTGGIAGNDGGQGTDWNGGAVYISGGNGLDNSGGSYGGNVYITGGTNGTGGNLGQYVGNVYIATARGNVGIGIAAATSKLHVNGTLNVTNITLTNNCADGQVLKWANGVGVCGSDSTGTANVSSMEGAAGYIPQFKDSTTLNNSVIYQNGASIGIGTTNPAEKLAVNGSVNIYNNLSVWQNLAFQINPDGSDINTITSAPIRQLHIRGDANDVDDGVYILVDNDFSNAANYVKVLAVTVNSTAGHGVVKLGQYTSLGPGAELNIVAPNNTTSQLKLTGYRNIVTTGAMIGGIDFITDDTDYGAPNPGNLTARISAVAEAAHDKINLPTGLAFSTVYSSNPVEAMRITSNGSVGIGTTRPTAKLQVVGDLNVTNITLANNCADGQILKWANGVGTCGSDSTGAGGNVSSVQGAAGYIPQFKNSTTLNNSVIFQNRTNIGIGTTAPADVLEIVANTPTREGIAVLNIGGANETYTSLLLSSTGEANKFTVLAHMGYNYSNPGSVALANMSVLFGMDKNGLALASTNANANMTFTTGGNTATNERMRITAVGNVGIGTTNPAQKLDVQGSVNINGNISMPDGFFIGNGGIVDAGGMALGTQANASELNSIAIGYYSHSASISTALGAFANANAPSSIAIGQGAVTYDPLGLNSNMIAAGNQANVSGESGIAIGNTANAAGSYGIALGYATSAPYDDSIALGKSAVTTASNQLVVGSSGVPLNTKIYGSLNATNILLANNCADGQVLKWNGGVGTCGSAANVSSQEGSAGYIPQFKDSTTLNNSVIYQSGTNIGIGITSPVARVEIGGTNQANNLTFNVSGALYVNGSSNFVGVNVSSPANALDVVGTTWAGHQANGTTTIALKLGQLRGSDNPAFRVETSDNGGSGTLVWNTSRYGFDTYWARESGTGPKVAARLYAYDGQNNSFELFNTTNQLANVHIASNGLSYLVGGALGIGTRTPTSALQVIGEINATDLILANNCADGQVLKWSGGVGTCGSDSGGGNTTSSGGVGWVPRFANDTHIVPSPIFTDNTSVGIGTTGPTQKLSIGGNISLTSNAFITSMSDATNYIKPYEQGTGRMVLRTNGADRISILYGGAVGINATTPTTGYALDVGGFINTQTTTDQEVYPSVNATQIASTIQDGSASTGVDENFNDTWEAIKFTAASTLNLRAVGVKLKTNASIANNGTITVYIYTDSSGPSVVQTPGASIGFHSLTTTYTEFLFAENVTLSAADYWIVMKKSGVPTNGTIFFDSTNSGTAQNAYSPNGVSWMTENSKLGWFKLYGRSAAGVYGRSTVGTGVVGASASGSGVSGSSTTGYGIYGTSANSFGVVGVGGNSPGGFFIVDSNINSSAVTSLMLGRRSSGTADTGIGSDIDLYIENSANNQTLAGRIRSEFDTVTAGSETSKLSFWTRNATGFAKRIVVDETGKVGIGTSAPVDKLTVFDGNLSLWGASAAHIKVYAVQQIDNHNLYVEAADGSTSGDNGGIVYVDAGSGLGTGEPGDLLLQTRATGKSGTIGKVGIGNPNPKQKLDVKGNVNASAYITNGTDYAESMQPLYPTETFEAGDIVSIVSNKITKQPGKAAIHLVVTDTAGVLGGGDDGVSVAFVGRVKVKVKGTVSEGDYILAGQDGTGFAKAPALVTFDEFKTDVIGVALADKTDSGTGKVIAAIGIK